MLEFDKNREIERQDINSGALESLLNACIPYRYPFTPDQPVQEADWEVYLRETAQQIVEQQTPKRQGNE